MARHTIELSIKNPGKNKIDEYTFGYLTYMMFNKEIIQSLGKKTHDKWHLKIGEKERIPYSEKTKIQEYISYIFESKEFKEDGWSYISLGQATLTETEQDNEILFKKWIQNNLDNVQVYFSSTLRMDDELSSIDFNISEETDSQIFFWIIKRLFESLSEKISYIRVAQTSGKTKLHGIFPDRISISWMQFIEAELLAEDIPSAYAVWYFENIGSIIVSTQEVFNNDNKQHQKVAHAIEQELHKIGLLPLKKWQPHIKFITRNDWRKNMGL